MASWATQRKLTYASIVFAVLMVFVVLPLSVHLFYKPPSCFDSKQNQNETGVDCGGGCALLCKADSLNPVILWQRIFEVSPGVYSAVAYVENPNLTSAAYNVPYVFRFYDAKNVLVAERSGRTSIAPITTTPIFEGGIVTKERIPIRAEFKFTEIPHWFLSKKHAPKISILGQRLADQNGLPNLTATLSNPSLTSIPRFEVVATLFDAFGNALASSKTVVDSLSKEGSAPVVFSWRQPFGAEVVKIDIIPKIFPGINY